MKLCGSDLGISLPGPGGVDGYLETLGGNIVDDNIQTVLQYLKLDVSV